MNFLMKTIENHGKMDENGFENPSQVHLFHLPLNAHAAQRKCLRHMRRTTSSTASSSVKTMSLSSWPSSSGRKLSMGCDTSQRKQGASSSYSRDERREARGEEIQGHRGEIVWNFPSENVKNR